MFLHNTQCMNRLTVSGYKIKTTRIILEAYLKILTEKRPCCTSIARMVLWDDAELMAPYTRGQFSMMIHNMLRRMHVTYMHQNSYDPLHVVSQRIGMMTLNDHIQLVKDCITLPAALCDDRSINV